ncbi:phage tail sheath subtilisin-like domain-containing protein [Ferrovibrio xuzhouensis]|uniref:Phage tail sheath subtilisin-like domain-containing protein n=1 Tax=Ferrovibrio xuzhouensis TaxID=1576914 RepID=A0ABV7VB32_9PROT
MPLPFNTLPPNLRIPLFYAEIDNSQASYFVNNNRALIIGQKLPAGTAPADVPVLVTSNDQAIAYFGRGSMLQRMVAAYRANDDFGELWCIPVDDLGAGVAATKTLTIGGPATAAGVIPLYLAGQRLQVGVAAADTDADIATAIAAAVNAAPDQPYTAVAAAEVVTLTARHKGLVGNDLDVRVAYLGQSGGEVLPAGVTVVIADGVAGAGNPDLTAAIAAMGDEPYDYIAVPWTDAASLDALKAEMNDATGRWSPLRMIYGHVFAAKVASHASLVTLGTGRNDPHATIFGFYNTPTPGYEIAASATAVAARSLNIDPARPLQTLPLTGVLQPPSGSRFTLQERNILAYGGIATLMVSGGYVRLERVITTYQKNAYDQTDPSFLNVTTVANLAYIVRFLRQRITQKFGRHKLAADGTAFGAGDAVVTPKVIRAELIAAYVELIGLGLVENLAAFTANLIVEINQNDPSRLDVLFAPDLVNELNIVALLVQFRQQYPAAQAA